jgi:hypothetical protein
MTQILFKSLYTGTPSPTPRAGGRGALGVKVGHMNFGKFGEGELGVRSLWEVLGVPGNQNSLS